MERAAFLIEATNERISCLLNPEHVVMQRSAGIRQRQSLQGQLTGRYRSDDPLLYTGGGRTELTMNLLFDVSLLGSSIVAEDVRLLTRPLWNLAENRFRRLSAPYYTQPPIVRFVWGKAWNVPGVIAAVSERLEYFNERGIPQRSWIRLMLLRTEEESLSTQGFVQSEIAPRDLVIPARNTNDVLVHEVTGAGDSAERLDEIAQRYYGDASMWRTIANANGISDPTALVAGTILRIPPIGGAA
jgi:hypothetical protein